MGNKLYVGGLPFDVSETQLQDLFASCGQVVSANLITDKYSGQSRGFGFVEMSSETEAQEAIAKLNGSSMGGRKITVNEARPKENRERGGGGGGGYRGGRGGGGGGGGYRGGRGGGGGGGGGGGNRGFRS